MQKHKMTTFFFTNNKKGKYKLHNIDAVKNKQTKKENKQELKIT